MAKEKNRVIFFLCLFREIRFFKYENIDVSCVNESDCLSFDTSGLLPNMQLQSKKLFETGMLVYDCLLRNSI